MKHVLSYASIHVTKKMAMLPVENIICEYHRSLQSLEFKENMREVKFSSQLRSY